MRKTLVLWIFILLFSSNNIILAQSPDTLSFRPFLEIGGGYLFNGEGTLHFYVENIANSYNNFNHGMAGSLRFGVPVFKFLGAEAGVSGKFSLNCGIPFKNAIENYYTQKYQGLNFEIHAPPYFMSRLESGPFLRYRKKKWQMDLELSFGFAAMHFPQLIIKGTDPVAQPLLGGRLPNIYVYVARYSSTQRISVTCPSISVGHYFNKDRYVFARAELMYGYGAIRYRFQEDYPARRRTTSTATYSQPLEWEDNNSEFFYPSFQVGTNVKLGK